MIDLYDVFKEYRVTEDYCEVCFNIDGEQRYLVDGVTICSVCLIDGGKWADFPELADKVEYAVDLGVEEQRRLKQAEADEIKERMQEWRASQ